MYIIATFRSRTQTMTFKQILLSYKVFSDIINTPRQASVSCGISVRFDSKSLSVAKDILSRRKFVIPRFQREYCWDKKISKIFFNDILKQLVVENNEITSQSYFLGTMLFIGDYYDGSDDEVFVVDGQQRLTTITILFSAMSNKFIELNEETLSKEIFKYIMTTDDNGEEVKFIHKSRVYPKKMRVVRDDLGKTKSGNDKVQYITVDQKQMVYYSQKYADKQKRDREKIIAKANDLISHPEKYNKATSYGVAGYVNNLKFVKSTGEIADGYDLSINQERIKEEEKYDGYYSIVTSEEHLSDIEIRRIYRGLAKIEETFKVTKSGLEARPVWVSRKDHIESHFLTCFIALVLIRLIEKKLDNKYSFEKIIESIRNYISINIEHDLYIQSFRNEVIDDFEEKFNIELSKKFKTLSEIKKDLK